jgi:DNA uptake protein ComE-like DNA-binding protein
MKQISPITLALLALFTFLSAGPVAAAPASAEAAPPPTLQALQAENQDTLVDINSATLKELSSLPGIGSLYSKKIVEGRPYQAVEDLSMRKVLPKGTYGKIQDKVVAKTE